MQQRQCLALVRRKTVLCLAAAALAAPPGAFAVTYTWPGASPCATTLFVCLNSIAAGSVVEIATNGPIDENVSTAQSLTLRAAPGFQPLFAAGRTLTAGPIGPTPAALNVTFDGLTLADGDVVLYRNDPGDASFVVRRMRLLTVNTAQGAFIRINGNNAGNLTFDVAENEISTSSGLITSPALALHVNGAAATGTIRFNRISSLGSSQSSGIQITVPGGTLEVDVFANEVRGDFLNGGINVANFTASTGSASAPVTLRLADNLVAGSGKSVGRPLNGIRVLAADADIDVAVANNTVTATTDGLVLQRASGGVTGDLTGVVRNNLVAFNGAGLQLGPGTAGVTNANNLVFGNDDDVFTAGPGTVTSDPRLVSLSDPRLTAASPAIDAGDGVYVQLLLALNGLPQVDLDGMRRTIGTGGVDIGAYEFGDQSFVAVKTTSLVLNHFPMAHPAVTSMPAVRPVLTKNFAPNEVSNAFAVGAWYSGATWSAFNQGLEPMRQGAAFNVFVPRTGGVFGASYAHVATSGNTSGHVTTLDQTFLNGTSGAIVLATSNWDWDRSGSGVYNDHHIVVGYGCFGPPGPNCWFVLNQDFAGMPLDAAFNVYAQEPSPNAYVHTVAAHNRPGTLETILAHRLLDGVPCAQVHVTQKAGTPNDHPYDVYYDGVHWRVFNQDDGEMPLGSEFYVLVNPRQVFECLDVIFEDGFEA